MYRPAVRDTPSLPIVYFLHGLPGGASDVFDAGAQDILDRLFGDGAPPFVLVAPDGNGVNHDDTEWADAKDGSDQLETWVTTTVQNAVEGDNLRPRDRRAIIGFSMGGYGAMNIALRHPDLYGQVVSIAGYFRVDDPDGMFGGDPDTEAANTPLDHLDAARGIRIALFDATGEDIDLVRGQAQTLHDELAQRGVTSTIRLTAGEHSWSYAASVLGDAFAFIADGYR